MNKKVGLLIGMMCVGMGCGLYFYPEKYTGSHISGPNPHLDYISISCGYLTECYSLATTACKNDHGTGEWRIVDREEGGQQTRVFASRDFLIGQSIRENGEIIILCRHEFNEEDLETPPQ